MYKSPVGGFNPSEKNARQIGSFPKKYLKPPPRYDTVDLSEIRV